MHAMIAKRRARGFTLLEVLIALLLFTISLVGFAGSMAVSLRSGNIASVRTQATFLAQMIEDRMRANPAAVIAGTYNGTFNFSSGAPSNVCTTGCTSAQIADLDTKLWGQMLGRSMPNGQGVIDCTLAPAPAGAAVRTAPWGLCRVTITWGEQAESGSRGGNIGTRVGRFDWVFNP
ncbi:MAG: type IV pilus modification protein PilV [Ahniella sp.]|nr:type IV pilus modification protein PilV [Ahniella sp.]